MKKFLILLLTIYNTNSQASVSEEEYCLALNIYFEARNQGDKGKLSVGLVTLNRVNNPQWPNTICEVVWQKNQFSWTHDGKSDVPYEVEMFKRSLSIAKYLISRQNLQDFTNGSTHYHATWMEEYPTWSNKLLHTVTIGQHIFYK